MRSITTQVLATDCSPPELWAEVARCTQAWLRAQESGAVDAVFLVPFAQLLPAARRAFASAGGWMPRIHTTHTLARSLGPVNDVGAGELTGEWGIDLLTAAGLLRRQSWADNWAQRDPRAFDAAVQRLVRTAQLLAEGAQARHPARRDAWWALARGNVAPMSGPGAIDNALLRIAIEWAASAQPGTDPLFALQPAAWIALSIGGDDPLATQLLAHAATLDVPVLCLLADPAEQDPFDAVAPAGSVHVVIANDAEQEAWAAALEVNQAIEQGATPVALIAEDRALVRRIRALLERTGTVIDDETGWSLATTRAGAHAFSALRAAHASASADDHLDWLKADLDETFFADLDALELHWRGNAPSDVGSRDAAQALWAREQQRLEVFAKPWRKTLAQWQQALDRLLFGASTQRTWLNDPAAVQLRRALHLNDCDAAADAHWRTAAESVMSLDGFSAWVDAVLESSHFVAPRRESSAPVVLTPLSRAVGRNFAAVVLPGADERRLGAVAHGATLLSESAMGTLELPGRSARQTRLAQAFVQLLRVPRFIAVRRRADGDELLAPSALLDRLGMRCRSRGMVAPLEREAQLPERTLAFCPVVRPAPTAGGCLPASLSASAVEALRQCPYRFFSRVVLHLGEQEELDDELDKRDYGRWLHASLERFHTTRPTPLPAAEEVERLKVVARELQSVVVQSAPNRQAALLPYSAGLDGFARRYVAWLHAQEAAGWRFAAAEVDAQMPALDPSGLRLHGRIDRIDTHAGDAAMRLIDYKTGSRASIRQKVAQPLEDTQLAVYAALQLARAQGDSKLSASYLALDEPDQVVEVEHPEVTRSALELVRALGEERLRIDAGAPLPALGEGQVCETCEARGLCRRDHWAVGASMP